MKRKWTIGQLDAALHSDLQTCRGQLERDCCKAICGREIRERAHEIAQCRQLTSTEAAVAAKYGWRPHGS